MRTVKVTAKIIQNDTGVFIQTPVLMDENNEIIQPFLDFVLKLKRDGKSQSTINNSTRATQRLLEYMAANPNGFSTPQTMFENFSSCLYSGTISEEGLDPSGLYWLPHSKQVAQIYIYALSQLTDWMAENHKSTSMNPFIKADSHTQRLNYAAWFRKNQNDFLGHIKDKHINSTVRYARSIQGRKPLGKQIHDAIEFPENTFEKFYFSGLGGALDCRVALRDQLILLLMHGGGLRESEALHLWIEDVLIDPFNNNSVKVRVYHPEEGRAPNKWRGRSNQTTRAAYLLEKYALTPRNQLSGKKNVGWKNRLTDNKDSYLEIHWFPIQFGEIFAKAWNNYMRYLVCIERNHPYAFISFHSQHLGEAYTLNAFHDNYRRGLKRIGLDVSKSDGLSPHSHRHAYGRRLSRAGVEPIIIKKCLHHSSIESQLVYTTPSLKEVTKALTAATEQLLNPSDSNEETCTPSWQVLLQHGFDDIDPYNLFAGKNPKFGKHK
ncbi:gamma-mobile-trio recombinase GmtY [Acinetobacter silvestris]|uniref:Integrase n=1 Tax=Acinetobacter silvestris TaxID=1977882 RepID=A0A1Y3CEK2_9GAMM|nr:gamma-mobile-trio recombinase GmtY [Acinetobacter silvestris]OTG65538.1 integrase [Acinetobacter silvestris]